MRPLRFAKIVVGSAALMLLLSAVGGRAVIKPVRERLPDFDKRQRPAAPQLSPKQTAALEKLRNRVSGVKVDFESINGGPKLISAPSGFLTGPGGIGKAVSAEALGVIAVDDPHRIVKGFLNEHRDLLGFGPEALDEARVTRENTTAHNGLTTVVWEQQVDGVPLFETVLIAHTTKPGELVNLSSRFVPEPRRAAESGTPNRAALMANPKISARQALGIAVATIGERLDDAAIKSQKPSGPPDAERRVEFVGAGLKGKTYAKLIWLPMSKDVLRLCWDVVFMSRQRGEMFRVLIDVQSGEALLRRCLTSYLTPATYNVFTNDSPAPLTPSYPAPTSTQPPLVPRTQVTLSALDTNASPAGWIDDGGNETIGNNVDAHLDRDDDDAPDLPRPQGSPFRVFDFPLDLNQDPTNYASASTVQLFYLCNWMHDKLYELGFDEAAGNFQSNNFGRGGLGDDAVQADAQDGGGTNNANFSTLPDGMAPRMQMYIFDGANPRRDGSLDAEVVLHEYTHGLSNRRVGGGVGISELQSAGMGEGWSDFYALSLLSQTNDDPDAVYALGGYITYQLYGLTENYYFGTRRYPYTTDLGKNPLTFKDIDATQADPHNGVPTNPIYPFDPLITLDEHSQGEVWCVTLWEARANFIRRYGFSVGNQLMLQLVTDGMNLSPPNPTFLEARDAILQADMVDNGGTNAIQLWSAFAKRGMGFRATSPASSTTEGVHESFDLPGTFVAILGAETDRNNADVKAKIAASGLFPGANIDVLSVAQNARIPTLKDLQFYNAVLVYSNYRFNDPTRLGDLLAQYIEAGGRGLVLATHDFSSDGVSGIDGRILDYSTFSQGAPRFAPHLTLVKDAPTHDIVAGVANFDGGSQSTRDAVSVASHASLLAHWSDGTPMVATREMAGGRIVGLNFWPPSNDSALYGWDSGTDGGLLMANALLWAARKTGTNGPYPTILHQPEDISVDIGGTSTFTVTAAGDQPLTYFWFRDGALVSQSVYPSLTFGPVQLSDSGSRFSCLVSNALGTAGSASATLTVTSPCGTIGLIDFDNISAPSNFQNTTHLTNLSGVTFTGPGGLDGGAILNDASNFRVTGYSGHNFLAFTMDGPLSDGGVARGPETISFATAMALVRVRAGTGVNPGQSVTLTAYDQTNALLATASITLSRVMTPLQVVTNGIRRVVISTPSPTLVLDDLTFVPSCAATNGASPQILASTLRLNAAHEFQFALAGTIGANYEIEFSNDLTNWQTMSIMTMTNSPIWCSDVATNVPCRFYRAKLAP